MDFTIFYKEVLANDSAVYSNIYDHFFSGFDDCDRTKMLFQKINATNKVWFIFPQYNQSNNHATDRFYYSEAYNESEYFADFIANVDLNDQDKVCIDITGFIRPHLLFLIRFLYLKGIKKIDAIYTEPLKYEMAEETTFSGFVQSIDSINGFSSININPATENDILIIAAGYDDDLISKIAQHRDCKKKYLLIGFPSIQPDMYQENILKIETIKNTLGSKKNRYVPAFDPFVTAQVISDIVKENETVTNLYLSPLSTKPQAIGMMLYYLYTYQDSSVNIIFPYTNKCFAGKAEGVKRTWLYTLELP